MKKLRAAGSGRLGQRIYVTVYDGRVSVMSTSGTPLCLTTIAPGDSMPLRFDLEDANTIDDLVRALEDMSILNDVEPV